jgi:hypothetical protein
MESWQEFFTAEVNRLREFYLIEAKEEDFKDAAEWLRDHLELNPSEQIMDKIRNLSPCDIRQLRYDFVQFVKRNRRIKNSQARNKLPAVGATHPFDEREERDRRLE